jgi:2-beta-glucuronyltransferase
MSDKVVPAKTALRVVSDSGPEKRNPNYLVITAHDYRTPRRTTMHFIADELAKRGKTRFFSLRYSALSRLRPDGRHPIADRANRLERVGNVDCFLWKTPIHPFNSRIPLLRPFEDALFRRYQSNPNPILVDWIRDAAVIIFESGTAPIYFDLARELNPGAKTIYLASDDLLTINAAGFMRDTVTRIAPRVSGIPIRSLKLASGFPPGSPLFLVPHGLDMSIAGKADPSPYGAGIHAVSVGSMLFDRSFFEIASKQFPEVAFHVIGSGSGSREGYGGNVQVYDEMKQDRMLRYIKHAAIGIAPYRPGRALDYLADTSTKLMQYSFFGLPAVCPHAVTGNRRSRFGYEPGNAESIRSAVSAALAAGRFPSERYLSWSEVTDRILDPDAFADTRIG